MNCFNPKDKVFDEYSIFLGLLSKVQKVFLFLGSISQVQTNELTYSLDVLWILVTKQTQFLTFDPLIGPLKIKAKNAVNVNKLFVLSISNI